MTKKLFIPSVSVFLLMAFVIISGCQFMEDVFKIGIWVGMIIVISVLVLIALVIKSFKK